MENNKGLTVEMYRTVDLIVYTFIACALEYLNTFVFRNFFSGELYTLSIILPITLICLMRWNGWAAVPAVLTAIVYCTANKAGNVGAYLVYIGGNSAILLNLLWFTKLKKKELEKSIPLQIAFTATGFLAMVIGRTLISLPFGGSFLENLKAFIVTEGLNGVIGTVIVLIAARQKDLFRDQMDYLKDLQAEKDKNARKKEEIDND